MSSRRLVIVVLLTCWASAAQSPWATVTGTLGRLGDGTLALPHTVVHHWRASLALALATGALVAFADRPASAQIDSPTLERWSNTWSNRGLLFVEPALIVTLTGIEAKCIFCAPMGHMALVTLSAEAYSTAAVHALKFAAGRERPYLASDGDGGFNESGSSFPSGHASGAFTMASVFAHEYPDSAWAKWSAYAAAGGVSGLRFTAKRHFPSDLVVGAALGWLTGRCAVDCA